MLKNILLIGSGGFIGSIARYYISRLNLFWEFLSIPFGTLIVNILGCFIIGFITGISDKSNILSLDVRLFLMVGFCGGFTTFSSFANENLMLLHSGQIISIVLYTALSVVLGFLAVYLGYVLSNLL
jgi:fluoride exporter